jgi:filamentous hemagglutinin
MSGPDSSPSNARCTLASITSAAILCAPLATWANPSADARSALQRAITVQGGAQPAASAPAEATTSAGSQAGLLADQARAQIARHAEQRQVLQSMQSAARAAAQAAASSVPNGLTAGGLAVAAGATPGSALWTGADLPTQTTADGLTTVRIRQKETQANLTWDTYDIGRETRLNYEQASGDWIAFNHIVDSSGNPSRILGSINAPGQVYVINPNGVIFGGTAQVNTRTLVASSLPIHGGLVARGLLNNPDTRFLFTGLASAAGPQTNAFTPPTRAQSYGDVIVEAGAILNSPTNADKSGGRIALIGANVANAGTLTAPDGQVILAAGLEVGLEASDDASLRGLIPHVGRVGDYAGNVVNKGMIDAARGAVSVAGKSLRQEGLVGATTTVSRNGRIDLLANYDAVGSGGFGGLPSFLPKSSGTVVLGTDSVTEVLPELASAEKTVGTKLALNSRVNIAGLAVHFDNRASLLAPSAAVSVQAGSLNLIGEGTASAQSRRLFTDGQIYLDSGASINVAGTAGVTASVAENYLEVSLKRDELANSPLQREGPLRGQTITVDMLQRGNHEGRDWVGTPLADVSGYVNLVKRNIGQLTVAGGAVELRAGDSVVVRDGARVDVSGGYIDYQGASVATTKVLSSGVLYDISKATPDLAYDGIYSGVFTPETNTAKWGSVAAESRQSRNRFFTQSYVPGFTQGGDAGAVMIAAPSLALDGRVLGRAVSGERQRSSRAVSGALNLALTGNYLEPLDPVGYVTDSRTPPTVRFTRETGLPAPGDFSVNSLGQPEELPPGRLEEVRLSPELFATGGLGRLTVDNREGDIVVEAGAALTLPAKGELSLNGRNVTVGADLTAPGGQILLAAGAVSQGAINDAILTPGQVPQAEAGRGTVAVAAGTTLSVAGLLENDAVGAADDPIVSTGGKLSLTGYRVALGSGSALDVSGGVHASPGTRVAYGNAGTLSILSGQDYQVKGAFGGTLELGAALRGYSGVKGGSLVLQAPAVEIGAGVSTPALTVLSPGFFQQGGFTHYDVRGLGSPINLSQDSFTPGLLLQSGVNLRPLAENYRIEAVEGAVQGLGFTKFLGETWQRSAVSVSLSAPGVRDGFNTAVPLAVRGDLVVGAGAVIATDPGARISLVADTVNMQGLLSARGGSITVRGGGNSNTLFPNTQTGRAIDTVTLGSGAVLDASGVLVPAADTTGLGLRLGKVLPGGSISVAGNVRAEAGSRIDVSGSSATLDLFPQSVGRPPSTLGRDTLPVAVLSNAGQLTLSGGQRLITQATLSGAAGGAGAEGGRLFVSSGIYQAHNASTSLTVLDENLVVTQTAAAKPDLERGNFDAAAFNPSGFDSLALAGTVRFDGPVELTAARELRVADGGVLHADDAVVLNASRVSLGMSLQKPLLAEKDKIRAFYDDGQPLSVPPTHGTAGLNVNAKQLIDVGNLSLQGFDSAELSVPGGDLRGSGTFDMVGDLVLRAAQIYPPTATTFTLNALSPAAGSGSITVLPGDRVVAPPYSAGGVLSLNASIIDQRGVLRAPFGAINLGWNGSGTAPVDLITGLAVPVAQKVTLGATGRVSVSGYDDLSGAGLSLPYGIYLNGTSWVDPQGRDITTSGPSAKQVVVSGRTVITESGSLIDIDGGGELFASRFQTGTGGKIDLLANEGSFAVVPGYVAEFAPMGDFNDSVAARLLGGDAGYTNSKLRVGDRIYLDEGSGLPAGYYTLLPARYALLPKAYLVTPKTDRAVPAFVQADGAAIVTGYRYNAGGSVPVGTSLRSSFEVAPAAVLAQRATYETRQATEFFRAGALERGQQATRLPGDAGRLLFTAVDSMSLLGGIEASASEGRGGEVDIDSPVSIRIAGPAAKSTPGELLLDATRLSAFEGASVLIGGSRRDTADGSAVTVSTGRVTVDNADAPFSGAEIILVAKDALTLEAGSRLIQRGGAGGLSAGALVFGDEKQAGSGNGVLLRLGGDGSADGVVRSGVNTASSPLLAIGRGAQLRADTALVLDSTGTVSLAEEVTLQSKALLLASSRISLQLEKPGALQAEPGLVLSTPVLTSLQGTTSSLSLFSYRSIDVYGVGQVGSETFSALGLRAPVMRGFNQTGGDVRFVSRDLRLLGAPAETSVSATESGRLTFAAETLRLGEGNFALGNFSEVRFLAGQSLEFADTGALRAAGDVRVDAPLITATSGADHGISAGGSLELISTGPAAVAGTTAGLGARLTFAATSDVAVDTRVEAKAGHLVARSQGGDILLGTQSGSWLDVSGRDVEIQGLAQSVFAGSIELLAEAGRVNVAADAFLNLDGGNAGADAGVLTIRAPGGEWLLAGTVSARAGEKGEAGRFSLDAGTLSGGRLGGFDAVLDLAGFTRAREYRFRLGDIEVDGLATAHTYRVAADNGSLTVSGRINSSGVTGGTIDLAARGDLIVAGTAQLDASADTFDHAGRGGFIKLASGASLDGVANPLGLLTINSGALLDFGVTRSDSATDAALGRATGRLHLRAPRTVAGNDLALAPIAGELRDVSSIMIEGFRVHDLTPGSGTAAAVSSTVRTAVLASAATFGNADTAIKNRVASAFDASLVHVLPGLEIVNRTGSLDLSGIWDLSTARYGSAANYAEREPGILLLRAAGNINLPYAGTGSASLSDGFGTGTASITTTTNLWNAPLLPQGSRSWSYQLVAGADLGAARTLEVKSADPGAATKGSIVIGNGAPAFASSLTTRQATNGVPLFYQVVRTGTGDIELAAEGDIELRNNLASIYTAGTRAAVLGDFDLPNTAYRQTSSLGPVQYSGTIAYAPHYSVFGGDVSLLAGGDILRTRGGQPDSSRQMPQNWLYRRGNLDADTGDFAALVSNSQSRPGVGPSGALERASTTWWVDFNNFFQGVGALGGGNVSLKAGRDVANVDAVAPTNARMPYGEPDASRLVELGGGDVTVRAGRHIDGGVYYVERGTGTLQAGGDIKTNYTRTTERVADASDPSLAAPSTWLPTTLFLGKGSFTLHAGGDLTLGAVANPFLLPAGINNSYFLKSYFSTYSPDSSVSAFSLTGDVTLRSRSVSGGGSLYDWFNNVLRLDPGNSTATAGGRNQPWLRLSESTLTPFVTLASLMPGQFSAGTTSGDVNLVGEFNIIPSTSGEFTLAAAGSINGLQPVSLDFEGRKNWASAVLNISDADPASLPSITAPAAIPITFKADDPAGHVTTQIVSLAVVKNTELFAPITAMFDESGSYTGSVYGSLQTKQALHAANSVHQSTSEPVRLLAGKGDISGLTLYSPKVTQVSAGRDITDVALYLQNLNPADLAVITAGRDILLYNPTSALRVQAQSTGNTLLNTDISYPGPGTGNPTAGDLQVGGPGKLLVLAGRHFDFGALPDLSPGDGTAAGLTSIGNARNLYLPDNGADVVIGVGVGDDSKIDRAAFDRAFLNPATAGANASRFLPILGGLLGLDDADPAAVWTAYSNLPADARAEFTLAMFNRVLRDAGRDHNNPDSPGFGTYQTGFGAISALFPGKAWDGDLRLSSRELRTSAGGSVTLFAPGGGLNLGGEISKSQTPPGIITERGGDISIFARDDVDIGTQRIFTLRGGDILIWSSTGDIAAGSSSTTLQSASPTRVLIDPQSGDVKTDLAGLATGGGIGVLAAVEGVKAGDVDLIAPVGTIDAGDAGIRSAGNINISALTVLNAANISAGGSTSGAPAASAPALVATAATPSPGTGSDSPAEVAAQAGRGVAKAAVEPPSFVTIDVIGYGGGDDQEKDKPRGDTPDGV